MGSRLLIVGVLALAFPTAPQAQRPDLFEGLGSLKGSFETLDQDARDAGFSAETLKAAVELRLRQSGIRVLDDSMATLYANVSIAPIAGIEGYVFAVDLELLEPVYMRRQLLADSLVPGETTRTVGPFLMDESSYQGTTWDTGSVGTASEDSARTYIRDAVLEHVDRFTNEYLAANPR